MRSRVVNLANFQQFTAINLLGDPGHDPANPPIPQCMEVRLNWTTAAAKSAHNVLHVRYPAAYPGSVTLANTIAANIVTLNASSGLLDLISTTTTFHGVSLRDKGVSNGTYVDSNIAAQPGLSLSQALPAEVAAVLTERTTISGPSGRGRIYLTGFSLPSVNADNTMTTSTFDALTAWGNGIITALNVSGLIQCLALPSRVAYTGATGTQHAARNPRTQDVIQTIVRDNHWDSQRRRGLK